MRVVPALDELEDSLPDLGMIPQRPALQQLAFERLRSFQDVLLIGVT